MTRKTCDGCRNGESFDLPFSMAFQPIVRSDDGAVFGYEALVRGAEGQGAGEVLGRVDETNRYAFDQACRVKAIRLAARLEMARARASLSINFLPNAVYEPTACIRLTLETAKATGFPLRNLIFEFTENERLDPDHVGRIVSTYRAMGFRTAVDDFGAGYAGLGLLARFQPDIVKLDMELVRGVDADPVRRALIRGTVQACTEIGIVVLGEGVETEGESRTLSELGVALQQGYVFARPGFETLPEVRRPAEASLAA